jgi:hypothetical protein
VFSLCDSQWLREIGFVLLQATGAIPQKLYSITICFVKRQGLSWWDMKGLGGCLQRAVLFRI